LADLYDPTSKEGVVGIHHINFNVQDLDRTVDFYTRLLGFELRSRAIHHGDPTVGLDMLADAHARETTLGLDGETAVLELTGMRVEFTQWLSPRTVPGPCDALMAGSAHLAIRVKDVAKTRSRLEKAGVVFRTPADHVFEEEGRQPWKWSTFRDPDGIPVELFQEQPVTDLVRKLGSRIRETRMARGLTLKQAATMSEISTAHLSQVERGDAIPSLPALVGISATLGVSPEYFLRIDSEEWRKELSGSRPAASAAELIAAQAGVRVVRPDDHQVTSVSGGIEWHWMTAEEGPLSIVQMRFEPGAVSEDQGQAQTGKETAVVLQGTLQVELGSQVEVLEADSTISYDRSVTRRFKNVGAVPATALLVAANCPPGSL
jgi:catechol 2,3-dioxygenase-like lactoylglutathione lyase family enzyme/transcriptional regulator with XRE-family HTH domain